MKMDGEYYLETQDTIKRLHSELKQAHGLSMRLHGDVDRLKAEIGQLREFEVNANHNYSEQVQRANKYAMEIDHLKEEMNDIIRQKWDVEAERDKLRTENGRLRRRLNAHSPDCDVLDNSPDRIPKPCNCHVHLSAVVERLDPIASAAQKYIEAVDLVERNESDMLLIAPHETPETIPALDALTAECDRNLERARRLLAELQRVVAVVVLGER